jgi:hypothetical protein
LDYLHVKASAALSVQIEAKEKIKNNRSVEMAKKPLQSLLSNEDIPSYTSLLIEQIEAYVAKKSKTVLIATANRLCLRKGELIRRLILCII